MSAAAAPTAPRRTFRGVRAALAEEFAGHGRRILAAGTLGGLPIAVEVVVVFLIVSAGTAALGGETPDLPFGWSATTTQLAVAAVCAIGARGVLDLAATYVRSRMVRDFEQATRAGLLRDFSGAEWSVQSQLDPADVLSSIGTNLNRARDAYGRLIDAVSGGIGFGVMLVGSFASGGPWVLAIIAGTALLALLFRSLVHEAHRAGEAGRVANLRFAHTFLEVFALAREIRLFGVTRHFQDVVDEASHDLAETNRRSQLASGLLGSLGGTAVYLVAGLGLLAITLFHVDDPRPYVVVVLLLYRGLGYGRGFQSSYQDLVNGLPSVADVQEKRRTFVAAAVPATATPFHPPLSTVSFRDVGLVYPDGSVALRDASFDLERGSALGLVGPSGSGKSTIVQLLLRLRLPTSGQILVNGTDLAVVDPASWFGRAVLVPQDGQLFNASVLDNVACFRPAVDRDRAIDALRRAEVLDEVLALPDGLDTLLGAGARRLSGGQVQRIAIARALAGSPELLVLDEPTSALDLRSEEAIRATLDALRQQIAVVVIAHRLSTLRICDRVMVLDHGHIEACGPRAELEASSAFYAEAVRLARLT